MRKVFLDDLPRRGGSNQIDWRKSVGFKVKFIYDIDNSNYNNRIEGELEIVDYEIKNKNLYLILKHNDNIFSILPSGLSNCKLGAKLNVYSKEYKYNIGDIIKTKTGKIEILELSREFNNSHRNYKYKCLIDGNIDYLREDHIKKGVGCNVCVSKKILKNLNSLWATHPSIAQLLKDPEIGYEVSYGSHTQELFVCPICKYEKSYKICNIVKYKFIPCPKCSDGISYFNKIAFNLLEQLNLNFIPEHNPDWIKPKRYDFYFELNNKGYILEMDGKLGHGHYNFLSGQTAEESQVIDDYKDMKAKEHNIEIIRIDCDNTYNIEFIKNNILHSKLNELFDLSNINWLQCNIFACSNRILEASKYFNDGKNSKEIAKIMKMSYGTIVRYLNISTEFGWCYYNGRDVLVEHGKNSKYNIRSVVQLSLEGVFINKWDSIREAEKELNISNISWVCREKRKISGGFIWMYEDDYYNNINSIIPYKKSLPHNIKSVVQLSLNLEFINEYTTIKEAEINTGVLSSGIVTSCKNKNCCTNNYKWLYKEDYEENKDNLYKYLNYPCYIDNMKRKIVSIVQLDLNSNFIKEYNSIADANRETNILKQNISKCCKRKRKSAGGFKWMYKEDYDEYIKNKDKSA